MWPAILYAGPSLNLNSRAILSDLPLFVAPPCQRGDIVDGLKNPEFQHFIIADGYFQQVNSVSHRELLQALDQGKKVWGLCSMGAIRAYELRNEGMLGFGAVYQLFLNEEDFQDDEVALIHGPAPEYFRFSEPMVHFRFCIEDLVEGEKISRSQGNTILKFMKERYFGLRTMDLFDNIFFEVTGYRSSILIPDFSMYRQKEIDLFDFLQARKWLENERTDR